ncbi:hypothetical protein [Ramlibacter sp.]|uniref:hypothetical protein n=1 Tax=Ramlibacter sp. TaxID=1917967 RepID=UPI002609292A|nr:hypothetical protein [Ramlibacter sp.]MDB5956737.1 hypothetical protein [Ramlibacter sp.]
MPMTRIFNLAYEIDGDAIQLEQDTGCGEIDRVALHPIHVQVLATELGMLRGDQDARRRVDALERRLRILRDRIEALDDMLWCTPVYPLLSNSPDPKCVYSDATLTLAEEWCTELPVHVADDLEATASHVAPRHGTERRQTQANAAATTTREKPAIPVVAQTQLTVDTRTASRGLAALERSSLTKLVIGMAIDGYGYMPTDRRSAVIPEIGNALRVLGISIEDDTVRKYVHEGAEQHISADWVRPTQN